MVLGAPALGMAFLQYRGTFRRHKASAEGMGVLSGAAAVLWLFGVVTGVFESLRDGDDLRELWPLFLTLLVIGASFAVLALINYRWARRLPKAANLPVSWKAWRFSLWELFGLVTAFALGIGVAVHAARSEKPEIGIHVAAMDCPYPTPAGATKISYRQGSRGTCYLEFDISEAGFREWVIERFKSHPKYKGIYTGIQPITGGSYVYPVDYKGKFPPPQIISGIECHWTFEDEGMHAVFDRATGRVYYNQHWH